MPKITGLSTDSTLNLTDLIPTVDMSGTPTTKNITVQTLIDTIEATLPEQGWEDINASLSVTTGYNKGNKECDISSNVDLTSILSPGMRFKIERGTTPPTQCTDLESSSSQYWSKTSPGGISFTDDFTIEAWVKLESYVAGSIVTKTDAGFANGFSLRISSDGRVEILGLNAGANRIYSSYQSLPLGKWVHIAASCDMSGNTSATNKIFFNGLEVPQIGTTSGSPSSLVQAGNLFIGSNATPSNYFDGKLADVRLWSAVRTTTQIRDNMNQQLVGNETNLIGYWKFNGNANDSTSNGNNLTASGSATATSTDNPMQLTEYALITKITASIVTVFTGTDHNIPNMTLNNPKFSIQKVPFGFPVARGKWRIESISKMNPSTLSNASYAAWPQAGIDINVPTGEWRIGWKTGGIYNTTTTSVSFALSPTSMTGLASNQGNGITKLIGRSKSAAAAESLAPVYVEDDYNLSTATQFAMYTVGSTTNAGIDTNQSALVSFAESAYI